MQTPRNHTLSHRDHHPPHIFLDDAWYLVTGATHQIYPGSLGDFMVVLRMKSIAWRVNVAVKCGTVTGTPAFEERMTTGGASTISIIIRLSTVMSLKLRIGPSQVTVIISSIKGEIG